MRECIHSHDQISSATNFWPSYQRTYLDIKKDSLGSTLHPYSLQMKILACFPLFLSSLLFLTVPLRTQADRVVLEPEPCKICEGLARCDKEGLSLDEVWKCMTEGVTDLEMNPPVDTVEDLYGWCCERCPNIPENCEEPSKGPSTNGGGGGPCGDCIRTCNINPGKF